MEESPLTWILFNAFILLMLAIDLVVFHRKSHEIKLKEALIWSGVWIALSLVFGVLVLLWKGHHLALQYFTGYLIEKSLSVDNLFVFLMIFSYFGVAAEYQHKVLFYGIVGALVMRALFIFAGVTLITKFHWLIYIFGLFLIYTGIRMAFSKEPEVHPERNPVLKLLRKLIPISKEFKGDHFFVKQGAKRMATPLLVVLLVIETTDVVFALDSIPAILAISVDPFIVFSSNVMAILGLRALYFALAGIMRLFAYLHYGLSVILIFVGIKMLIADLYEMPIWMALGFVGVTLSASVILSILYPSKEENGKVGKQAKNKGKK